MVFEKFCITTRTSANTHAEVQGTGGSSYKITAKADITFDKNAGGTFQELPCKGMFTGKIDTVSLNTDKPTGSLKMSNFAVLNWFMSKATVDVDMTVPDAETYQKIADGTPVEVTVKINILKERCTLCRAARSSMW